METWIQNISYSLVIIFSVFDAAKYTLQIIPANDKQKGSRAGVILFVSFIFILLNYYILGIFDLVIEFVELILGDTILKRDLAVLIAFIIFQIPLYKLVAKKKRIKKYGDDNSIFEKYVEAFVNARLFLFLLFVFLIIFAFLGKK
ncbi:hypothetical protein C4561_01245 [candidate division WWE3 bacterium]|jgi:hypothetical protein|uniref:Uncharacterized protein n=1 Tax=candidate division WWE3 bacterium TaxID=2053526 RepID=A0A3A4ZFD7_UNCKA|nr:MAG: hypothetical protein C4561_01245 [candidate division WWE3 bacterium]